MTPDDASLPRIPVVDLARRAAALEPELTDAVARVVRSGTYLFGPELDAFERELAIATRRDHAVGVSSGTDALRLALVALGIGPGDEVIVPAFTAVPTAAAVCATGAVPVFADVEPATATLDAASARAACTERTRAVIPVHLYGRPAVVPELGVPVVEDGAQAFGALEPGSRATTVAYSFYPTKNLGGITDGGAVTTDDAELAATLRLLRAHGHTGDYVHTLVSTNARLSDVAAAALRVGLPRVEAENARRREIAARYRAAAPRARVAGGTPAPRVPPVRRPGSRPRRVPTIDSRSTPACTTPARCHSNPRTRGSCDRGVRKRSAGRPSAYRSRASPR